MSNLAELLENQKRAKPGFACKMSRLLDGLDAEDRTAIEQALADTARFTAPMIVAALTAAGHDMDEQAIRRHRTGKCCRG